MARVKYKFMAIFEGQYVNVITRSIKGTQYTPNGKRMSGNMLMMGILVREDEEFVYLSDNGQELTDMIKKDDIVRVFLDNPVELMNTIGEMPPKAGMN